MKAQQEKAEERRKVFDTFAAGVAALIGRAFWDRLEHEIIRRSDHKQIADVIVLDTSGVGRKLKTGTIEFHRLIYVLATFERDLSALPQTFPIKSALRLGGMRYLSYRQYLLANTHDSRLTLLDIETEFPVWKFIAVQEIAKKHETWFRLLRFQKLTRGSATPSLPNSSDLMSQLADLRATVTQATMAYAAALQSAFGEPYEDLDLGEITESEMPGLIKWVESVREAHSVMEEWISHRESKKHEVWRERHELK